LPDPVETRLKELFDVELRDPDTPMSREELVAAMNAPMCWCRRSPTDRRGAAGQAGDKLKLIANYGAGVDHIDVPPPGSAASWCRTRPAW
jgi:glyoxylate reductase